ncbi:MAG: (Na+)-NQR maturation NqrM [Fidelibacterota bacterium]|jgi:hypothetical protein|tara:strand:- start:453 stop:620 length:168 start_codon:yes stop_codon:yes gene_type:complete
MEFFLGILILSIAIAGMAVGVIFNKKPLSGSCGGLNNNGICALCGSDPEACETKQ